MVGDFEKSRLLRLGKECIGKKVDWKKVDSVIWGYILEWIQLFVDNTK